MADVDYMDDCFSDYSEEADAYSDESDFDFDDAPKPKAKASKKTVSAPKPKAKKTASKKTLDLEDSDVEMSEPRAAPLGDVSNNANASSKKSKGKKTVEETYKQMSQLEHILLRPDTYIGSIERVTQNMWILQGEDVVQKEIEFTPGLFKIYDEILVNAADNKQRNPDTMDKMEITVDAENNLISVLNNGKGLPVQWHNEAKCYVPTLVFGRLLTGSNFDDAEKKTTGGRNGYGAKLANIFSTEFIIECGDSNEEKIFRQRFTNNMRENEEPVIKKMTASQKKKGDYVKVSFKPDLAKFKMDRLDEDTVQLLSKRAYDIAGSLAFIPGKKLTVSLNGKKLPIKKFDNYLKLYKGLENPIAYEVVEGRWEVGVGAAEGGTMEQVSFVNAICTSKGGEHVNYIADQVAKRLVEIVNKKNKGGAAIKAAQVKNHISIFVNCLIDNPTFDSQTKEFLTTKKSKFGSKCELSAAFLKKIEKSDVVTKILNFAKFKEREKLGRKGGKKVNKLTGIKKLDDANKAGTKDGKDCTLILTEGDSAKSLAMSGISVVGRDYYGVFPLKGKPLNVRDAAAQQVMKNEEISNLVNILGLKYNQVYDEKNIKELRYGHLMIMADQDHDGSHIKGLIINFLHHFWPSLLDVPGFLTQFITPIIKASKGKQTKTFFTLPEYNSWKESTGNDAKGWKIKYYKGLGTSTSAEAKEYFSQIETHEIQFNTISSDVGDVDLDGNMDLDSAVPDNASSGNDLIEMVFSKNKVEERKTWLNNIKPDTYLDYSEAQVEGVNYSTFVNSEFILFSQADNIRSIPHILDGFKPSQRKVLFGCFLRNLKLEMKVAQLSGYVGEKSAYHHGEASLQGTIVNMAQDFVGSNNINLLTPSGQFGTRRMGGKDHASARYIFTKLEQITRMIFHPDDDELLNYLNDDGQSIEPVSYMPVIPMILVNGADGIGTGYSTNIPNFSPRDIIANLRRKIKGEDMVEMHPQYFGFTGQIDKIKTGSYCISGKIERVDDETLLISELPVKSWTQDYKQFLEQMMTGEDKKATKKTKKETKDSEPDIKDFKENHTDTTVSFTVTADAKKIDAWEKEKDGLMGKFKLTSKLSTSNMTAFDSEGKIIKFHNADMIMNYFYDIRLDYYVKRKEHLLANLEKEQRMLSNKARFIEEVCAGDLVVTKRKKNELLADLKERGYDLFPKAGKKDAQESEDEEDEENESELAAGYQYLLGMKIWALTFEKAKKLREELEEKNQAVEKLKATAPTQLWESDLDDLEAALDDRDEFYENAAAEEVKSQNKAKKSRSRKTTKARKKKSTSSDDDDDDDEDFMPKAKTVRKKKAPVPKPAVTKSSVLSSVSEAGASKPVTKAKPAAKPKPVIKPVININDSDDDSDDDLFASKGSLMDRLKSNKSSSSLDTSSSTKVSKAKSKKRGSPKSRKEDDDEDLSFDLENFEPASLTPAPKKSRKAAKVVLKPIQLDSDDEMEEKPKKKPAAKKAAPKKKEAPKKKAAPKKTVVEESFIASYSEEEEFDEDLLDESEDEDDDFKKSFVKPPPRARSGRARTQKTYTVDSDSDSDFDFDE